jgi:type I restriction enzyme S subunit
VSSAPLLAGWTIKPLIEVATLQRGYDLPVQDRADGPFPIFAANGPVGLHATAKCKGPGVVTGRSGTIGKVHFVTDHYWPLNTSLYVTDFHGNDPKWIYYMLKNFGLERFSQGAGVPTLNRNLIHGEPVRVPPVCEQRRIAAILDKADALRTKRRKALAQLDHLAQSIFVEMFGDPSTNPKGWSIRPLKSLGKVSTGGTPPSALEGMFNGEIPFITPGDLESGMSVKRTVTEAGAKAAGTVRAGATLVCCIGATIGKMDKSSTRSAFNQQLNAVEWEEEIDDTYGLAALRFYKPTIIAWGASTTLPILKKSSFEKIEIPVPPIEDQRVFSRVIKKIENSRETQKKQLYELEKLFAALNATAFLDERSICTAS